MLRYANFWPRLEASMVDGLIILVIMWASIYLLGQGIIGFLFNVAIGWLYFAGLESSSSQATLGKKLLHIKVTNLAGQRITFARSTGRYFAKIISLITLLFGFIISLFTKKKQALHDLIAGTLVVVR